MSQGGALGTKGNGGTPIETLSGNSGGAVGPDGASNIDLLGNNITGLNIVGTPASNLLTIIGLAASETQVGTVELATPAETTTGTSSSLAVHPTGLNTKLGAQTSNGLIFGEGGAGTNLGALGEGTDGQLPIGNTGGPPILATITADANSGLTVTNGAGSITIKDQLVQQIRTMSATVFTITTVIPHDDTIPQNTEGDEVISITITPKNASNILNFQFSAYGGMAVANSGPAAALFQDTTVDALAASVGSSDAGTVRPALIFLDHTMSAGTTSTTTFKIRCGPLSATTLFINADNTGTRIFGGVSFATLIVSEYTI